MYCVQCGAVLQAGQSFCPACGKQSGNLGLIPAQSRLAEHIRLLAILWLAVSAIRMIPGIAIVTVSGWVLTFLPPDVPGFVIPLVQAFGCVFIAGAATGLVAGWGLLKRRPWARMLAIVLSVFSLFEVPFGTALGIYTLWVLLPAQSEEEFRQLSNTP